MATYYRERDTGYIHVASPNTDYPIARFEKLNAGDYKIVIREGQDMLEEGMTTDGNGNVISVEDAASILDFIGPKQPKPEGAKKGKQKGKAKSSKEEEVFTFLDDGESASGTGIE